MPETMDKLKRQILHEANKAYVQAFSCAWSSLKDPKRGLSNVFAVTNSFANFAKVSQFCCCCCCHCCSVAQLCLTHGLQHTRLPCPSWCLLRLMSVESVMPSKHLVPCCPFLLPSNLSQHQGVFSNESALRIRWPKYWSFSFHISPSNEHPGLISFRMDWLDLLAVQGTLKSLLQHHSSKASILQHSAFLIVQLSHPYMTTEKTIALTRWTFVGKVIALLFNMLSRLVIGEGNGTPLQYSCLENPMDGGAW